MISLACHPVNKHLPAIDWRWWTSYHFPQLTLILVSLWVYQCIVYMHLCVRWGIEWQHLLNHWLVESCASTQINYKKMGWPCWLLPAWVAIWHWKLPPNPRELAKKAALGYIYIPTYSYYPRDISVWYKASVSPATRPDFRAQPGYWDQTHYFRPTKSLNISERVVAEGLKSIHRSHEA